MLAPGFLGALSDWVSEQTAKDEVVMDKAAEKFGLRQLLAHADEPEKIGALFAEWLVFDYKQDIFGGRTGLEFFTEHNPLHLPKEEIEAYTEMRSFEVGLFEALRVEPGRGILLRSIASGLEHFTHSFSPSWSVQTGDTVWTRIAPVGGLYHSVGCLCAVLPVVLLSGMQETVKEWKRNSFDAKNAASLVIDHDERESKKTTKEDTPHLPSLADAERRFTDALKRCGMDGFFSLRRFRTWLTNEKKYDLAFSTRALFFLAPETLTDDEITELMDASQTFSHLLPRKKLGGKSPHEAREETPPDSEEPEAHLQMDSFSRETYAKMQEEAQRILQQGRHEEAFRAHERIIIKLLEERTPCFSAFRVFANAAVCCFHSKELKVQQLGEPLLDASLRLNPLYDFGKDMKKVYVNLQNDLSRVPRKDRDLVSLFRLAARRAGEDAYHRTPFRKYEQFLAECGISLTCPTKSKMTVWRVDEESGEGRRVKMGRNDPCYCGAKKADGSPVKHKHCHGK